MPVEILLQFDEPAMRIHYRLHVYQSLVRSAIVYRVNKQGRRQKNLIGAYGKVFLWHLYISKIYIFK